MKARLFGLLALVLCAVMVASSAMAAALIVNGETIYVHENMLILPTDTSFRWSSDQSGELTVTYNGISLSGDQRGKPFSYNGLETGKVWKVASMKGSSDSGQTVNLESVEITVQPTKAKNSDHYVVGTTWHNSYTFEGQDAKTIRNGFNSFARSSKAGMADYVLQDLHSLYLYTKRAPFIYNPDFSLSNETTVTFPYPEKFTDKTLDKADFTFKVLHGEKNHNDKYADAEYGFEDMTPGSTANATQDGIQINVTNLSPFAVYAKSNSPFVGENKLIIADTGVEVKQGDVIDPGTKLKYINTLGKDAYLQLPEILDGWFSLEEMLFPDQEYTLPETPVSGKNWLVQTFLKNYESFGIFAILHQTDDAPSSGNPDGGNTNPPGGGNSGGNPGTSSGTATREPDTVASSSTPKVPQTGDHSQLALWFALAVLSLAGVVLTVRRRKA